MGNRELQSHGGARLCEIRDVSVAFTESHVTYHVLQLFLLFHAYCLDTLQNRQIGLNANASLSHRFCPACSNRHPRGRRKCFANPAVCSFSLDTGL